MMKNAVFFLLQLFSCLLLACQASFAPTMVVQLREGDTVTLKDLPMGTQILTGVAESLEDDRPYSPVYALLIHKPNDPTPFVQLKVDDPQIAPLLITGHHFVYSTDRGQLRADQVKVGDRLETAFGPAAVTSVNKSVTQNGAISPLTVNGKCMVNFILTSAYMDHPLNHVTHLSIAPFRLFCWHMAPTSSYCTDYDTESGMPKGLHLWSSMLSNQADPGTLEVRLVAYFGLAALCWVLECLLMVPLAVWICLLGLQRVILGKLMAGSSRGGTAAAASSASSSSKSGKKKGGKAKTS